MEPITIRRAVLEDADLLVRQRRGMFVDMGRGDPEMLDCMESAFRDYLEMALPSGELEAWIAEAQGIAAGGIGLVEYRLPPGCVNPTGRFAYAVSLYVERDMRRRGIATALVRTLVDRAHERGIGVVALHASEQGRRLYERLGFEASPEMRLRGDLMAGPSAGGDDRDDVRERFGRAAEGYVRSATHRAPDELATIVRLAAPLPTDDALDIATGGGHTALALAPHVARVVASDITGEMLEAARAHIGGAGAGNVDYALADAEALPFADASFDIVTCRIAAHHFPRPERFVNEAARVLRPGGRFVLQDQVVPDDQEAARAVNEFEAVRDPSHARSLAESEWVALLARAGLEIGDVEHFVKRHDFVGWCALQSCTAATVETLVDMLARSSDVVREWTDPQRWGTPDATFANRQVVIAARRP